MFKWFLQALADPVKGIHHLRVFVNPSACSILFATKDRLPVFSSHKILSGSFALLARAHFKGVCMHRLCLLLGKWRSAGAASPVFPDHGNLRPRRVLPDLACGSLQREIAQPGPLVPSYA